MCRRTITLNYKYNHSNRKETFLKFIFYRTLPSLTMTRALFFLRLRSLLLQIFRKKREIRSGKSWCNLIKVPSFSQILFVLSLKLRT